MRFPISKLSQIFHRRSKSDTALSRRLDLPSLQRSQTRRPHSASFLEGLAHAQIHDTHSSFSSEILARVPTTPVSVDLPRRPISVATLASAATATTSCTQISVASHTVVVEVLTRRIQELEAAVRTHEASTSLIASLEAELSSARASLREESDAKASLSSTVAGLESEIVVVFLAKTEDSDVGTTTVVGKTEKNSYKPPSKYFRTIAQRPRLILQTRRSLRRRT
ncbi:hypothetical protein NM688_g8753 [Phlebia brevispora]|uniref:Uncharacterized protein n=1 Tax=Phlebia brevispora TaxID=194682 RepID=A0ACC1RNR1_9APHY|nr:hypothetical protein NM688_g8753 [Phlebia brevispora]